MTQLTRLIPSDRIIRLQGAIIIAVALLFAGLLGSRFFSLGNFQSIASQLPILGLLALGMGITMLTGGINLSIIAGANACSLVMAAIIVSHPDQPLFLVLALLAGLLVAVAIGALNGVLVAWIGVSPILASLGTMTLITGLNILLSNGAVISGFPAAIQFLCSPCTWMRCGAGAASTRRPMNGCCARSRARPRSPSPTPEGAALFLYSGA
jgi:simple sugar transport system permease protein